MMHSVLVLNVDDYEAGRYAKTRLLKNAGFEVQEAANGLDALRMIAASQPAIVLLDVRLPDLDGREVCRRIKADIRTRAVHVVQTSAAFISKHDAASGMESGAAAYIPAPFEPDDLIATLRSLLH
jgi:CheY-like chemotaxis protein